MEGELDALSWTGLISEAVGTDMSTGSDYSILWTELFHVPFRRSHSTREAPGISGSSLRTLLNLEVPVDEAAVTAAAPWSSSAGPQLPPNIPSVAGLHRVIPLPTMTAYRCKRLVSCEWRF